MTGPRISAQSGTAECRSCSAKPLLRRERCSCRLAAAARTPAGCGRMAVWPVGATTRKAKHLLPKMSDSPPSPAAHTTHAGCGTTTLLCAGARSRTTAGSQAGRRPLTRASHGLTPETRLHAVSPWTEGTSCAGADGQTPVNGAGILPTPTGSSHSAPAEPTHAG